MRNSELYKIGNRKQETEGINSVSCFLIYFLIVKSSIFSKNSSTDGLFSPKTQLIVLKQLIEPFFKNN